MEQLRGWKKKDGNNPTWVRKEVGLIGKKREDMVSIVLERSWMMGLWNELVGVCVMNVLVWWKDGG